MRQLSIRRLLRWLGMQYLVLGLATMASAQGPYSPQCQKIADQIKGLEDEKQSIASDLGEGKVPGKAAAVAQINKLQSQISALKGQLSNCVKEHPYVVPPKQNPCADLGDNVQKLKNALAKETQAAVAAEQGDLQHAAGSEKPAIVAQIKRERAEVIKNSPLVPKIADAQKKYNKCVIDNGGKLELNAIFSGRATMTTSNDKAPGPFTKSVSIGVDIGAWVPGNLRIVHITSFDPISVTYDTHSPAGTVTTTVSLIGGSGNFDEKSGNLTLDLSLFFHHSYQGPGAGDSRLDLLLQTTSPLDVQGHIAVSGSSQFKDGFLDMDTGSLTVDGHISPRP